MVRDACAARMSVAPHIISLRRDVDKGCPQDDRTRENDCFAPAECDVNRANRPRVHLSLARRSANSMSMMLRHGAALAIVGWCLS
jgi:hypothetical protein